MIEDTFHAIAAKASDRESGACSTPGRAGAEMRMIAMRGMIAVKTIRRPKIVVAVFAAAALLFGFAAKAQAQATDIVYVSNTGQTFQREESLGGSYALAQRFRTGGKAGGYDLKHIEIDMYSDGGVSVDLMTNSAGSPGTKICDLTLIGGNANGTFNKGIVSFGTSASCTAAQAQLGPSTDYWVAIFYVSTLSPPALNSTASNNEDSGAIAGWSINNRYRYKGNLNSPWADSGRDNALQIRVVGTNTAPTSSDKTVTATEDMAYTFQTGDFGFTDADNDSLNAVKITELPGDGEGTLSLANADITTTPKTVTADELTNGNLVYTPPADKNGPAFAAFKFKVNDFYVDSVSEYTMDIDVEPEVTGSTTVSYAENGTGSVATYSANGSPTWSLEATGDYEDFSIDSATGELTFNSPPDFENPADGDLGNDYDLTVVATISAGGASVAGTLGVTVTVTGVNEPPTVTAGAIGITYAENATTTVETYTITDPEGGNVQYTGRSGKDEAKFTESFSNNNSPTVTVELLFVTAPDFETPGDSDGDNDYEVSLNFSDGSTTEQLDVTVTVTDVNEAPVVTDDTATTNKDRAVAVIRVLDNDSDVDGDTLTVTQVGTPSSGDAEITGNSTTITYTLTDDGFLGDDPFRYTVSDGTVTANGMVTVTVTPNADLSGLDISAGGLTPAFTAGTTDYTVTVAHAVFRVTLTPTVDAADATATVNGTEVDSGGSFDILLEAGRTTEIKVAVTNGNYTNTYTIEIFRQSDQTRPSVEIATEASAPVTGAFTVSITFSEAVTGFESSDIEVSNGTVANFTEVSSREYRATIEPTEVGPPVMVEVPEEVAEDGAGNGNEAAAFTIETAVAVSFAALSYTATEGGEAVTVTVQLSRAGDQALAIPIGVMRPETTEVGDYRVEGLQEWDAQAGTGTLTFPVDETEQAFRIAANHDGDGDDETLELGFGELPEIVMAGEAAVAIVTLEDKGLVELEVSFGQAAYEVKEGQKGEIAVNVSPTADRRVAVPLVVASRGGATDADYKGIPASVVFKAGESQRTITVEVLMDDVNDPGEGIVLSLGELPQGVSAGEPFSTEVQFEQRRMAERFSQTLEVMTAVIARSTAVSAQTAIEGRFERHRQWSRSGLSVGALPTAQPGSDNSAAALSAGETGSGWNAEHGGSGAPGSWLRSLSLGSLGNLARFDPTHRVVSPGSGMAPSGSVYRQDLDAAGAAPPAPGSGDFSGMRGQAFSLSGVSFELSSGASEAETSRVAVLWGQGDVQRFNGDLSRLGMAYRGGLEAAHIGLDLYANDQMLAGLSFMRSWGDVDYTDDGIDGVLESRMTTFHPYLYWQLNGRLSMWSIGGFGGGQVAVEEPGRAHRFNADFRMLAGGVRAVLSRQGSHEWGLRGDGFTAYLETGASADIAPVSGDAHRGRLLLDWVHDEALSVGRSLSVQVEAGWRFDGGDAERGRGLETGIRLGYQDAHRGLDVALHGRVLVVHASDYRDWGLGVQASWDPGEKQRGFRASLTSSWGRDDGGRTTLWANADAVMHPAGMGALGLGSQYRMAGEVAYGGVKALGLPGLLTPYSRLRWDGQGRELALGTAWSLPTGSQQGLPLLLELETTRREAQTGPADLAVLARLSLPF